MRGKIIAVLALPGALLCGACVSAGFGGSQSWYFPEGGPAGGMVEVAAVKADKQNGWLSIEQEIRDMAPLFFLEAGFGGAAPAAGPLYIAEIQAREREYIRGWKTRRSLSVEVRLRSALAPPAEGKGAGLLLAAGRAVRSGSGSLSSSGTLSRMLEQAIGESAGALSRRAKEQERKERREQRGEEKKGKQGEGEARS